MTTLPSLAEHLADRQLDEDRRRTARFPELLARKLRRMSASPLAFLRGSAPLFSALLGEHPELAAGPPGEGWIVGDLHLENFGAYRADDTRVVFDLNDFDDTVIGPWRLDVLRLTTSLLLGGRELGADGVLALKLADAVIEAWCRTVFDGEPPPSAPAPVVARVEHVRARNRAAFLKERVEGTGAKTHFQRGERYAELAKDVRAAVPEAFAAYLASLSPAEHPGPKCALGIVDAALRIAGTGSLGGLRIAVLVEEGWIFDLKEQGEASAAKLVDATRLAPAERVVTGFRACIEHPPRALGTSTLAGLSLFGRRLAPQEDKLALGKIAPRDLPALATYLGALLGRAHARGARKRPHGQWSKADREGVRQQAVRLAGIHEATYLALCERIRPLLG